MPFKLLLSEEITPAIRRIAVEQLTRARRELSSAQNIQSGVHQSRKCLKRVRSLLRMARPIIGEEIYRSENRTYRDLGRALARPRDAGALLETILKFEGREDMAHFAPLFFKLKQLIIEDKASFEAELEIVALSAIVETLDASISRWKKMPLKAASFEKLAHGFAASYDRGRDSLKEAIKKDKTFYLHEWRKDVQQTWRHMQILTLIWPEDIMLRIRLAQEISKLLGTEHDISELVDYMRLHNKTLKKQGKVKSLRVPFQKTAKTIRRDLCLHAVERGRRLYAFDANSLSDAMSVYWLTARAMQPMPSLVRAMAEIDGKKINARPVRARGKADGSKQQGVAKDSLRRADKTDTASETTELKVLIADIANLGTEQNIDETSNIEISDKSKREDTDPAEMTSSTKKKIRPINRRRRLGKNRR